MIVLDASVTGAWFFQDETTAAIEEILRQVADKGAVVPSIWQVEVANTLRTAVRRQRLNARRRQGYFDLLSAMPIEVDEETVSRAWTTTVAFSDRHNLTSYDAAYLELAIRRQLPLATTDRLLINAAIAEGLTVLP